MTGADGPPGVEIRIDDAGWSLVDDLDRLVRAAVRAAWASAGPDGRGEVSLLFTCDDAMRALNARYRGIDAPTNVLAFPCEPPLFGDIALGIETVTREAREQSKPLGHHVSHLVVHGVLHLLGFDHHAVSERRRMERLEISILDRLAVPDPYRPGGAGTRPGAPS